MLGSALFNLGELDGARRHLEIAREAWQPDFPRLAFDPVLLGRVMLGFAAVAQGDAGLGDACVRAGLAHAEAGGTPYNLLRLEPVQLGDVPPLAGALDEGERALAVARGQGARLWELRAATSLVELFASSGERDGARGVLAGVADVVAGLGSLPDARRLHEVRATL